jgi:hypothetical protein
MLRGHAEQEGLRLRLRHLEELLAVLPDRLRALIDRDAVPEERVVVGSLPAAGENGGLPAWIESLPKQLGRVPVARAGYLRRRPTRLWSVASFLFCQIECGSSWTTAQPNSGFRASVAWSCVVPTGRQRSTGCARPTRLRRPFRYGDSDRSRFVERPIARCRVAADHAPL